MSVKKDEEPWVGLEKIKNMAILLKSVPEVRCYGRHCIG